MEELTALPRDPSWIWGMGGQEREGKKKRECRAGEWKGPETVYSR